jgi:hypothetical protein
MIQKKVQMQAMYSSQLLYHTCPLLMFGRFSSIIFGPLQ